MSDDFWQHKTDLSRIKIHIILAYFQGWSGIISSFLKNKPANQRKIGYVDLFSGPGKYGEGDEAEESTPMLILRSILRKPDIYQTIQLEFNDVNPIYLEQLKHNIGSVDGIEILKYKPKFTNFEVNEQTVDEFYGRPTIPTLFFLDPWGYKGLSLSLFQSLLSGWGCECIFFFNYNRINMGLGNDFVEEHMNALFGDERANHLRTVLDRIGNSDERELQIVNEIAQALLDMGGKYVLPFRFKDEKGKRTSHYLIFVSKNIKGYELMKGIMANVSSVQEQGVASFEFNQSIERQPTLFELSRPLDDLKVFLLEHFAGQTLSVEQIYIAHTKGTRYIRKNYKIALRELEIEGSISVKDPEGKTRRKGTFADHLIVTFPPKG